MIRLRVLARAQELGPGANHTRRTGIMGDHDLVQISPARDSLASRQQQASKRRRGGLERLKFSGHLKAGFGRVGLGGAPLHRPRRLSRPQNRHRASPRQTPLSPPHQPSHRRPPGLINLFRPPALYGESLAKSVGSGRSRSTTTHSPAQRLWLILLLCRSP